MNGFVAQTIAAFVASLAMYSGGFLFGWSSLSLPKLLASDSDIQVTTDQGSWIVSLNNFGSIFGPLIVLLVVDRIGRKLSLCLTGLPMLICWLMIGLATNYLWLYEGRFIGGLGEGSIYVALPMYMGEIAEDRIRGGLGALNATTFNTGMLIVFCIGPWVSRQTLAWIYTVPPIIFSILFFWIPDTPYFYLMKDSLVFTSNREAARSSLVWLRRRDNVGKELAQMERTVYEQQQNKTNINRLVSDPVRRRAFLIVLSLLTFQQLTGVMAIQSYASTIFAQSGSSFSSNVSTIIMGVVKAVTAIGVVLTVDITGRRPSLLFSAVGVTLCMIGEAVFFNLQATDRNVSHITWLPLVAILGFFVAHNVGLASLPYVIIGEIFPTDVKAQASTVVIIYTAIVGTVVTKLYQVIQDAYGIYVVFYGFAICTAIGFIFIYFCVPETKGRSLQEVQDDLHRRTH